MGFEMTGQVKNLAKQFNPKAGSLLLRAHKQWNDGKPRSAFRLILAAAKLGDPYGQQNLGYFYDVGIGVKPNRAAAMHWYMRAYRQGDCCSANNIGTIYRDEGDSTRALEWFERAVDLGDSGSGVLVGLPDAEIRAGGILEDRHAAKVHDVESWGKNFPA